MRLVVKCHENDAWGASTQAVAVGAVGFMRNLPELAGQAQGLT